MRTSVAGVGVATGSLAPAGNTSVLRLSSAPNGNTPTKTAIKNIRTRRLSRSSGTDARPQQSRLVEMLRFAHKATMSVFTFADRGRAGR